MSFSFFFFFFCRPLFCGETSIEQIVDIVKVCGPITQDDLDLAHIDSTVPIADMILNKKFHCHIILPDFIERLQVQMEGKIFNETFNMVFENVFKYVPNTRWDAEQIVAYIEWNLWKQSHSWIDPNWSKIDSWLIPGAILKQSWIYPGFGHNIINNLFAFNIVIIYSLHETTKSFSCNFDLELVKIVLKCSIGNILSTTF